MTFDLEAIERGDADLLVWEAFVSGKAKNRAAEDPHVDDARLAVTEFVARHRTGVVASDVQDTEVSNLVAANLLASGLSPDIALLHRPCLVVRSPDRPTDA